MKRLKRIVIKEELYYLTGSTIDAVILGQFLYWSERVKDFDDFIKEEKERDKQVNIELTHGWIYKSAKQLSDEIMMDVSKSSIRRSLLKLVSCGWLKQRTNPNYRWDKTFQYRVEFKKLQLDLEGLGYHLEGYYELEKEGIIKKIS